MGHTPTASPAKIIRIAKAEVGYHEGRSHGHWNNHQKFSPAVPGLEWSQNQAWCATFVSWCAMKAGFEKLFPRTASTDLGASWFKHEKRWSEYPAVGTQVFFGYGNDMNHTGLVYDYDDTYIYTVEGNTNTSGSREGDGVYLKKRRRRSDYVRGYGYPAYAEGIVSADPAWASKAPKPRAPRRTRIERFLDGGPRYDMTLLDKAVENGRVGTVKHVRDGISAQMKRLPRDKNKRSRVSIAREAFATKRQLRMGALWLAITKGGRHGTVKSVHTEINRLISTLPKK